MHLRKSSIRGKTLFDQQEHDRQDEIVKNYMRSIDMPDWYRGLSAFQLQAANNLITAIRDDLEQDTTYRVRNILNTIGLRPPPPKKVVRFTMRLSRGNDLAFLWFLKDMFYSSDEVADFNLNEQLILTCIANLDLIFTIRGLNNILPPEQKPQMKRESRASYPFAHINKQQLRTLVQQKSRNVLRHQQKSTFKKTYKLPYLNALRQPLPYGKSLSAPPPVQSLHLEFLDVAKDPNYIIPNEANRWFADYQVNVARHTAASIVSENLDTIFNPNITKLRDEFFDAQVLRRIKLPSLKKTKRKSSLNDKKVLCAHHQMLEELEENLEQELRVIAQDKCLKHFDIEGAKKKERITRLRKQIESDVNMYMKRFSELKKKSENQVHLWSKENFTACSVCSINSEKQNKRSHPLCGKENELKMNAQHRYVIGEYGNIERQRKESNVKRQPLKERNVNTNYIENSNRIRDIRSETELIGDCLRNDNQWNSSKEKIIIIPSNEKLHLTQQRNNGSCTSYESTFDRKHEYIQNYNYGHSETPSESSGTFFNVPKHHQPYKFDYSKIFDMKSPYDPCDFTKMCVKAIETNDEQNHTKSKGSLNSAINEYTSKTFNRKVQKYNETNKKAFTAMQIKTANQRERFYNPNDKNLMHKMLEDALRLLAKDARYVLPTLPDAHKMPILRYWMYQRYGKTYTYNELLRIFKKSLVVFRAINKMHIHEKLPTSKLIGNAVIINYSCHNYLMKKTENVRKRFYKKVDYAIMERTRRLFTAMSPYLCTGGPNSKTVFAYLPARRSDIYHFNVWSPKTSEVKWKKSRPCVV